MIARVFFIIVALIFIFIIISRVKKKRFFEKESFVWLLGSTLCLVLSIFPKTIDFISNLLGIYYGPSLLFLISIMFVLLLLFRQSEQVSLLKEQVKHLGQKIVVLEKIIEEKDKDNK